jgi:hypothetical protein
MAATVMVDPLHLQSADRQTLGLGQLLERSLGGQRQKLIAGRAESESLVIDLADMEAARAVNWPAGYGVLFDGARLEVEPFSATLVRDNSPMIGSAVLAGDRLAILCGRGRRNLWVAVDRDEPLRQDVSYDDLVFRRWRIVWGDKDHETELFAFGG